MQQIALDWGPQRKLYSVSELNALIRGLLDDHFGDIWVSGEISGVRPATSGHVYFTLKDREAQLRCVCFRSTARYLKFRPQDGMAVLARGRIDVFEARGEYQLIVDALEPQGHGALQLAFEQLKKKLAGEGLFDTGRKRPLPKLPERIGIVTSPAGAVIQDMLNILTRRFPGLHIRLFPAQVQGEGSVESVCRGIEYLSRSGWAQVLIVARGGGSLEDLWTFNEEAVARAIAACSVPVISAVGHETDFTIADFVADMRAPTPSAAAELVVCTREQLIEQVLGCRRQLEQAIRFRLSVAARRLHERGVDRAIALLHRRTGRGAQRIDELEYCLRDHARARLRRSREQWQELDARLRRTDLRLRFAASRARLNEVERGAQRSIESRLNRARGGLAAIEAHLTQLSPLRVLERGYAIVQRPDGAVIRDAALAPEGAELNVRLARGRLRVDVRESVSDGRESDR
ncbi:MAG TPA: exodeoxyribonuclease VII large subunit [Bryobacteraceae bacterium]|nr:exodeoxyribonuclease VII large subunit [Bryobacteraceae bacterium]